MANKKITELTAAGALAGTEPIEIVQGGVNKQTTTQAIANLGGAGGGHTIEDEGTPLTQRTKLNFVGAGVTVTDDAGDDASVVTIPSGSTLTSNSVSTAGATITLDMNSEIQRMFVGSASFATGKTIAFSNATNALVFNLHLQITDVAATFTFGTDVIMSDSNWNSATNIYTCEATGKYEIGGSFDGTNWKIKILGPFL